VVELTFVQELSEEESADITQAAPYSKAPIRYVLELPTCSENDPNRHRTSIRNFFAALQSKPITGENLITELEKLYLIAVDLIGEPHNPEKAVKFVRKYVQRLKLDDCRYFRANALRLLAWCERTQWEKGWLESFAHCVGMMGRGIDECEAYTELSDRTKRLLHKSHRKQRHEIRAMERILADFDMVGSSPSSDPEHHAGIKSTRAFQQFLLDYYGQQYGSWPPKIEEGRDGWLDRTLAQRLQEDFGSVYDLLVNNNVVYGCLEHEETPQLLVIDDEDGSVQPLQTSATASEFPLWDVIQIWDTKCNFEPVPHPWVLLPKLRKITSFSNDSKSQQSLVSALQQHDADRGEEQSGLRNAYMKGTNGDVQREYFPCGVPPIHPPLTRHCSNQLLPSLPQARSHHPTRRRQHARRTPRPLASNSLHDAAPLARRRRHPGPMVLPRGPVFPKRGPQALPAVARRRHPQDDP